MTGAVPSREGHGHYQGNEHLSCPLIACCTHDRPNSTGSQKGQKSAHDQVKGKFSSNEARASHFRGPS